MNVKTQNICESNAFAKITRSSKTSSLSIRLIGRSLAFLGASVLLELATPPVIHANDHEAFFESQVRPLLVAKCLECHGESDPEGGLKLTSGGTY